MKHSHLWLFLLLFIVGLPCFSQSGSYLYYFDKDLNISPKKSAIFTGIGKLEGAGVNVKIFNLQHKNLVLELNVTDSTLASYEGMFRSFYTNGYKETEGNYTKNVQEGAWLKWDTLGFLIDSSIYRNGIKTQISVFKYHDNGLLRELSTEDLQKNTLSKYSYDDKGALIDDVIFNGNDGVVRSYVDGKVKIETVHTRELTEAEFSEGQAGWNKYVMKIIEKNIDSLTADNKSGTCILKFIIDTLGNISNVEATTMQGSYLARIATKAIQEGPKWTPAKQYGRLVKAYRIQPITFTINN